MSLIKDMKSIMRKAHDRITINEKVKEAEKAGVFRAGSSGAIVDGHGYTASCGRLAQARLLGYQSDPTQEMRVMFNGGLTLEDYLEVRFKAIDIPFYKEREVKDGLTSDIVISGRPDFDVYVGGKWVGIEVKSLASPFSVIKQRKNRFPFIKHMVQAATYMLLLNRNQWLIAIGHSFHVNQNGQKFPPEVVWYELKWNTDLVEGKGFFVVTNERNESAVLPFGKEHIIAFYKELASATKEKRLMGRPFEYELNVDTYSRCNYCPMKSACNEYDAGTLDFQSWLSKVQVSKEKDQTEEKTDE
jgi:PD-(D/E)XK nuclease superfamily